MIYLASGSPRRKKLLRDFGMAYRVLRPDYDERPVPGLSFSALVKKHALEKALSAVKKINEGLIVAADTVVVFRGKVIGKPKNLKDAVKTLSRLAGHRHRVYTGVAILRVKNKRLVKKAVFFERTGVRLKKMSPPEIRRYLRRINPLDKAGSYAIQSKFNIVSDIRGSFSNAVGLPLEAFRRRLKKF